MQSGGGRSRRIQKGERGLGLYRVLPAWGGGKAQQRHSVGHSLMAVLCSRRWDQRVGSWRGGQHGGRSWSPCLVLQQQNPGWSGLKSAQFPPSLSLLLAALKSPVASRFQMWPPDVAWSYSRWIKDPEATAKLLAFPPPSFSNGACLMLSLPCLPSTTRSVYQVPRGTGGWVNTSYE